MHQALDDDDLLRPPVAVFFDLDHTLYDYDLAHRPAMLAMERRAIELHHVPPDAFRPAFDAARAATKARLGTAAASHSRLLYAQGLLEGVHDRPCLAAALDLERHYWSVFLDHATLFPGMRAVIDALGSHGVPRAIVSDLTTSIQFRKLLHFELEHSFEAVVTSEEAGADKPDPRMMALAAEKLGVSTDRRVWVIGDAVSKDGKAARQLPDAVFVHWADRVTRPAPEADVTTHDATDLLRWIERIPWQTPEDATP